MTLASFVRTAARDSLKFIYPQKFFARDSYSQEGEDILLRRLTVRGIIPTSGTYIDVGAHHPLSLSNTYSLYKLGWSGVTIEPNYDLWREHKKYRSRDIALNCGVSTQKGELEYFRFKGSVFNTFDENRADEVVNSGSSELLEAKKVSVKPLKEIVEECSLTAVDLLSVDVEGFDLDVLESFDWSRFKPRVVIVEDLNFSLDEPSKSAIHRLLSDKGYKMHSKLLYSLFYLYEPLSQ